MPKPPSEANLPVEWVSSAEIRRCFNHGGFYARLKAGDLIGHPKRSSHPLVPPEGEPVCTRSEIVYYYTHAGAPVAVVHQYLRPDGTIGASGVPDPKRIILEDRIISVRSEPEH